MPKYVTLSELAAELGCDTSALRHAIRRGRLTAEKDGRTWRVTRTEATRYTRQIGPPPPGFILASEASRRIGVSRQRVHQLIAAGRLPARRTADGRVLVPEQAVASAAG